MSVKNNIPQGDRRSLIEVFQEILYAKDADELQAAKARLHSLPRPSYIKRVEAFLKRKREWALLYRAGAFTRGQNTYNYSEASI
ncbi:hypothetical protein HPB50_011634 [Hyalomma asiaticum]|uniref:Uncharacterized protein n=1 Tax=Hyalomma asiaticum TaxID=266040 RepID=A0ACB7TGN5_HYAAI|nr:hypothetical protein HPB50_011634 [Hyalomma asiaticum]